MADLIRVRESTRYKGLFVHKYHRSVFFKNLWHTDNNLLESRGRVTNSSGEVVVNPFTKVFNYKENGITIALDTECVVVEKINGFMATLTWVEEVGEVVVSTTGSLDSKYVDMAKSMLPYAIKYLEEYKSKVTYIFEIVHPDDPHIIKENLGAYLLGVRCTDDNAPYATEPNKESLLDRFAADMRVARPQWGCMVFDDVLRAARECRHEGYMVYSKDTTLKLKSPYYLALKAIARKRDILSLDYKRVDEEFYPLLDHLRESEMFNNLPEQERLNYMKGWLHGDN